MYILKWLDVCCVNFTSIKKKKRIQFSSLLRTQIALHHLTLGSSAATSCTYFLCSSPLWAPGRNMYYLILSCSANMESSSPTSHTQDFCPCFSLGWEYSPQGLVIMASSSPFCPSSSDMHELTKDFPDYLIKSSHPFLFTMLSFLRLSYMLSFVIFFWDYPIYLFTSHFPVFPHLGDVEERCFISAPNIVPGT